MAIGDVAEHYDHKQSSDTASVSRSARGILKKPKIRMCYEVDQN